MGKGLEGKVRGGGRYEDLGGVKDRGGSGAGGGSRGADSLDRLFLFFSFCFPADDECCGCDDGSISPSLMVEDFRPRNASARKVSILFRISFWFSH